MPVRHTLSTAGKILIRSALVYISGLAAVSCSVRELGAGRGERFVFSFCQRMLGFESKDHTHTHTADCIRSLVTLVARFVDDLDGTTYNVYGFD